MGKGLCGESGLLMNLFGGEEDFLVNHYDRFDRRIGHSS